VAEHKGRSLDVATAYFTVGGFGLVKEGLLSLGNFRLLLGAEPTTGEQVGLRPEPLVGVSLGSGPSIDSAEKPHECFD
jgi:hypothetical protein